MTDEDHLVLSLKYKRECIPLYILYWNTTGYIKHAFNTHTQEELSAGSPEWALMTYRLRVEREKQLKV